MKSVSYLTLLKNNSSFRRLWFAQVISEFGDWFNLVATLSLLSKYSNKTQVLGTLLILQTAPFVLLVPLVGWLTDRYDRRKIMILSDLARAFIVLGYLWIPKSNGMYIIYALAAMQFSLTALFEPARSAYITSIASSDELLFANSLSAGTWSIMFAIGSSIGGIIVSLFSLKIAFLVDSLSFVISAYLLLSIKFTKIKTQPATEGQKNDEQSKELLVSDRKKNSLLSIIKSRMSLISVLLIKAAFSLTGGMIWLLITVYGQKIYPYGKEGSISLGFLYGMMGIGAIAGTLAVKKIFSKPANYDRWSFFFLLCRTPIFLLILLAKNIGFIAFASFFHMATTAILWVISTTMIQTLTPNKFQGRFFSIDNMLNTLMFMVGVYYAGWLMDHGYSPSTLARQATFLAFFIALGWGILNFFMKRAEKKGK